MAARVLVVTKRPLAQRLEADDLARLRASGVLVPDRLAAAAEHHQDALATVRAALAGLAVTERGVDQVSSADAAVVDLVVTVGGDGTVFTANTLDADSPLLTVNSDPGGSVGHFTRARATTVAALVERWRSGQAQIEEVPRLQARVGDRTWRILNDCLFSSRNPAAMTRYLLEVDGRRERQRSSGVWVATAAGSTAAIRSAGAEPVPAHLAALLFRVREPFQVHEAATILHGTQTPPRGLRLVPAAPGISLYIDGPNITVPLAAGTPADFTPASTPLRLVR
jgi:NAD+ kinase